MTRSNINSNITTTGDQTFGDAVTLQTDTTLSSVNTTFNKTVTGDRQLTIKASEATTFNGEVNVGKLTTDSVGSTRACHQLGGLTLVANNEQSMK